MKNKHSTTHRTKYLSRMERQVGARYFLKFNAFNGLSWSFLGDSAIILMAVHFNAGNLVLGFLSSVIYVSGFFLLLIPRLLRGCNIVTVGFWSWIIRGSTGLFYTALFYLNDQHAIALIVTLYTTFCVARTVGMAMVATVQKRIVVRRTASNLVFRTASSFNGMLIISRLISFFVLSLKKVADLVGLVSLSLAGVAGNVIAAFMFLRIPNRTQVEYRPGKNIFGILSDSMKIPESRRILFLRWITLSQTILLAMMIPFMRRSVGLSSGQVFLFTVVIGTANFLSSTALRPIVIRAGSRPILFFASILLSLFLPILVFVPETLHMRFYSGLGFFSFLFLNAITLSVNRLLVGIIPDDSAVGFNSMETFVTSLLALLIGFGAGSLANLSAQLQAFTPINSYGLVFFLAFLGSLLQIILALRIKEPGSIGLRQTARLLTKVNNLKLWQAMDNLEKTADPFKRRTIISAMGQSRAPAAEHEIRRILEEPLSNEKGELIEGLFFSKRPEFKDYLLKEAANPYAYHRKKSIFALGAYPGPETEEILEALLSAERLDVRAAAAKSLGRIGSDRGLPKVKDEWKTCRDLPSLLDFMIALFHMDPSRNYLTDVFQKPILSMGEQAMNTIYTLVSRQFGMYPSLGILYGEETQNYGSGVDFLLEESRDTAFLLEQSEKLKSLWINRSYKEIWKLCLESLKDFIPPEEILPLVRAMKSFPVNEENAASPANTLAVLYFTYQILTSETKELNTP